MNSAADGDRSNVVRIDVLFAVIVTTSSMAPAIPPFPTLRKTPPPSLVIG
jgi:hypothetical protein